MPLEPRASWWSKTKAGFHQLADALGGVPVCLNKPVKDACPGADFPAGPQTLNGRQSLASVRRRHGLDRGDLDRTKRRQAFPAGATRKLKQDVVTDEWWGLLSFVLSFVQQAKNPSGGKMRFTTLPVERFGRNRGEDVNVVDDMKIKRLIAEQIGPKAAVAPGAPDTAPSAPGTPAASGGASGEASPPASRDGAPPSAPAPSASPQDGGGIPCVD